MKVSRLFHILPFEIVAYITMVKLRPSSYNAYETVTAKDAGWAALD